MSKIDRDTNRFHIVNFTASNTWVQCFRLDILAIQYKRQALYFVSRNVFKASKNK